MANPQTLRMYPFNSGSTSWAVIPLAPSITATVLSANTIRINITDNSSNETAFSLERSLTGTGGWTVVTNSIAANATSYDDTVLQPSTTYYYRMRALSPTGNSSYSNITNATTQNALTAPTITGPTQVNSTTLRVGISGGSGATSWTLEKSTNGGTTWASAGSVTVGATQADTTVTTGQSTQLRIAASAGGSPVYSNVVTGAAGAGGNIFESALSSFTGWDGIGSAWSIQSDGGGSFARCSYTGAGTGPYQLRKNLPVNPATGQPAQEYYIAWDMRQSNLSGTSKMLKLFGVGIGTGQFSDATFNGGGYSGFTGIGYGNNPTGANDGQCVQRFSNSGNVDPRSAATIQSIYRPPSSPSLSNVWRRFFLRIKQNTISPSVIADGEFQVWIDSLGGDGPQLYLDVRGLYNHGEVNPGFSFVTFGDYTSRSETWTFDVRNVTINYSGMPD